MRYHFLTNRKAIFLKVREKKTSLCKDTESLEPSYTARGNVKWLASVGNNLGVFKKLNIRVTM